MKKTLIDLFEQSVEQYANHPFLLEKTGETFEPTTYAEVRRQVYRLGAGLQALGVRKGEHMSLLSEGRNLWIIGELAMFYAGAVNVPLSVKLEESNDLLFRLQHSETRYIMTSASQVRKIRAILDRLPLVQRVILLDEADEYGDREISLDEVNRLGDEFLRTHTLDEFRRVGESVTNDDHATITYTSGTTADPKGVVLTHRNYTANVEQALTLVDIDSRWRTLVILPLDHCFAHVVGVYIFLSKGASVATVQNGRTPMETLKNIPTNIQEVRPYLILSVPALAKSFKKSIESSIRSKGKVAEQLFRLALRVAETYNADGWNRGKGARMLLKPCVWMFDRVLFSKVREAFGGELRFFIGGGALLDKDLQRFYYAVGLPMFQGYGLSEATPIISSNGPQRHTFGSSGAVVRPLDIRICDSQGNDLPVGGQGEIVVRGENVMAGYWKNPEATAQTVRDGWLYTGDLGYLGSDGLLYVLGRFKSLLIGSDGEKYSPEGIEEALAEHIPAISQVMLYNNQNPYTVALIVPNREFLRKQLSARKIELGTAEARAESIRIIESQLCRFKSGGPLSHLFPNRWLPATFAVLPEPFTEQNQLINSTLKLVRGKVEKTYRDRIEQLYTGEGKNLQNDLNTDAMQRYV